MEDFQCFLGTNDKNIKTIEKAFDTKIVVRAHTIKIEEPYQEEIKLVIRKCFERIEAFENLLESDVSYLCLLAKKGNLEQFSAKKHGPIAKTKSGKLIYPKTIGQTILCEAMEKNEIVFSTGVAGTGAVGVQGYCFHQLSVPFLPYKPNQGQTKRNHGEGG